MMKFCKGKENHTDINQCTSCYLYVTITVSKPFTNEMWVAICMALLYSFRYGKWVAINMALIKKYSSTS